MGESSKVFSDWLQRILPGIRSWCWWNWSLQGVKLVVPWLMLEFVEFPEFTKTHYRCGYFKHEHDVRWVCSSVVNYIQYVNAPFQQNLHTNQAQFVEMCACLLQNIADGIGLWCVYRLTLGIGPGSGLPLFFATTLVGPGAGYNKKPLHWNVC